MVTRRGFLSGTGGAIAGLAVPPLGLLPSAGRAAGRSPAPIDRKALVSRHDVVRTGSDPAAPPQVGNGRLAFGADITGLQTFVPFATMSDWGWHDDPLPPGQTPADFQGQVWDTHGRPVRYSMPDPAHPAISQWLISSPNRMNLARIGLRLLRADGTEPGESALTGRYQRLDLWTGTLHSRFAMDGEPVTVETSCSPADGTLAPSGAIAVRISSPLVSSGRLGVFIDFPYNDGEQKFQAPYVGIWDRPDVHVTTLRSAGRSAGRNGSAPGRAVITHKLDGTTYHAALGWQQHGSVNDGWYGKFHMEMYWWHCAHQALWNRWDLLDRSLGVYRSFLPSSRDRAARQGYRGARWPKMTDPAGRMAPGEINALLIWQQPHPIMFAELDYRAHPGRATLLNWQEIVEATADFMASYAFPDTATGRYVLGPPAIPGVGEHGPEDHH